MQRARCYLLGETAVVLELEPPVTLATQKRIWRLTQRLADMPEVVETIPGMNNITVVLRSPHTLALDAIERLQRWWEESEALEPEVARHSDPGRLWRYGWARSWRGGRPLRINRKAGC